MKKWKIFQKYGKCWSILLGHFIKHKLDLLFLNNSDFVVQVCTYYLVICFFHVQISRKSTSVWNCGRALMPSGEVLGRWAEPHPSHLKWPFLLRFCVHQFCLFLGAGLLSLHLIRSSSSVIFNVRGACYFYSLKCTHWVLKQKKSQGLLKF